MSMLSFTLTRTEDYLGELVMINADGTETVMGDVALPKPESDDRAEESRYLLAGLIRWVQLLGNFDLPVVEG